MLHPRESGTRRVAEIFGDSLSESQSGPADCFVNIECFGPQNSSLHAISQTSPHFCCHCFCHPTFYHILFKSPNRPQDIKWGATLAGEPVGDLCFGCGSAIDTVEDEQVPTDEAGLKVYDKRSSLAKQALQDTEAGNLLLNVIVCASKIVLKLETAEHQQIAPARASMETSVSRKSEWTVGFVSKEYWEKTNPALELCGITEEYDFDERDNWTAGFHATTAPLDAARIPYKPVTFTVKRKAIMDEEMLGADKQIRVGHTQTVFQSAAKQLQYKFTPASMQNGLLEMPDWNHYMQRAQQVRDLAEKRKAEREAAKKAAEDAILGKPTTAPEEPRVVIQTQSACSTGLPLSMMSKAPAPRPPAGGKGARHASAAPAAPSQQISVPRGVAGSHIKQQTPVAVAPAGPQIKAELGSLSALGGKGQPPQVVLGGAPRTQAVAASVGRRKATKAKSPGSATTPAQKPEDGTQGQTRRGRHRRTPDVEVEEIDQSQFKQEELSVASTGLLEVKHVKACIAGWKGLKTVNAVQSGSFLRSYLPEPGHREQDCTYQRLQLDNEVNKDLVHFVV